MSSYHHGNLRAALIEAAVELARAKGPDGVVLREVARRPGSRTTLPTGTSPTATTCWPRSAPLGMEQLRPGDAAPSCDVASGHRAAAAHRRAGCGPSAAPTSTSRWPSQGCSRWPSRRDRRPSTCRTATDAGRPTPTTCSARCSTSCVAAGLRSPPSGGPGAEVVVLVSGARVRRLHLDGPAARPAGRGA